MTKTKLTYTLSGVPTPNVTWGFAETETILFVQPTAHKDKPYINDYTLEITSRMCGKTIYFKATGYQNQTTTWNKPVFKCGKVSFILSSPSFNFL